MSSKRKSAIVLVLCVLSIGQIHSQSTVPAAGGTAMGSGGSATYSVGQLAWNMFQGSNHTILQGVQQPFEISVVTSIENTEYINLVCKIYPNPTRGVIKLIVISDDFKNLRFRLYDINGTVLQDKPILDEETEILTDNFFSSACFLRVTKDNREVKVFKIIKL
jgi:hypothetical protein